MTLGSYQPRGNTTDRARRREWLLTTFRADVDVSVAYLDGRAFDVQLFNSRLIGCGYVQEPACRCYRCGKLLSIATLTVDRVIPGCKGGTYRRNNIRPACFMCNSETGARLRSGNG